VLSWQVGDVKITRVVELEVPLPYNEQAPFLRPATPEALEAVPWLFPHFVSPTGAMLFSIHALLVDAPGMKLIVDTCIGNDRPRGLIQGQILQTPFLRHLEEAGFERHKVDRVVCTHLHVDHVGWNTMLEEGRWVPTFPNARYLIGRTEYEHWKQSAEAEAGTILGDSVTPIFDAGLVETVETDHRISPEICLIPTPGHTPGHVSVLIESKAETAVITGDIMHHPCQIAHPEWTPEFEADMKASTRTRQTKLAEWCDRPVLVIGTHFPAPTAGHIVKDGESYRFAV
jgi:glyoxylase-like metal-dependent hydrolase (beta-lactamase superfamily II)